MLIKVYFSEIRILFTIFLHRRNRDLFVIFFFKDTRNYFYFKVIRRRNNYFKEVKKRTTKT